jgi:N-acetylglucosamine kinase-like BadF-type ATPase
MGYLLGIDGGGTRTTVCLADDRLSILSRVQAGPSNPIKVGAATTQRVLARACHQAFRKARARPAELAAVCAGLAGGDSSSVQRRVLGWLRKEFPARAHMVTTDAAITLAAALGEEEGAIVIAGTGSIAYGRDQHGRTFRVGGWGSLFDDAGSGYDIGRRAIAAALRAYDGRGRPTRLVDSLCREFHLGKIIDIVAKPLTAQQIAALFPLVQQEARAGDAVARNLCREAADDLAELALTMIRRLGRQRQPVRVICSGGVFQSSPMIRRAFAQRVQQSAPRARISLLQREPVEGALLLARQLIESQNSGRPVS